MTLEIPLPLVYSFVIFIVYDCGLALAQRYFFHISGISEYHFKECVRTNCSYKLNLKV